MSYQYYPTVNPHSGWYGSVLSAISGVPRWVAGTMLMLLSNSDPTSLSFEIVPPILLALRYYNDGRDSGTWLSTICWSSFFFFSSPGTRLFKFFSLFFFLFSFLLFFFLFSPKSAFELLAESITSTSNFVTLTLTVAFFDY